MATINNPILSRLIDDIDGSLDTIIGDDDFTDEEVTQALRGVHDRLSLVLYGDDGLPG